MRLSKSNRILLAVASVLFVASSCLIGSAVYAKYITQVTLNGKLTVRADIGTIVLQEHNVKNNGNGLFELVGVKDDGTCDGGVHEHIVAEAGHENGSLYHLLPGLDIPKDPHVIVEKDNDMPVYVFVEVCGTLDDSAVSFTIDENFWIPLKNAGIPVSGIHGGVVYVYSKDKTNAAVVADITEDFVNPVYILKDNKLEVKQDLLQKDTINLELTFYACMYQVKNGASAADIYNNNIDY